MNRLKVLHFDEGNIFLFF
ncbi:hypothetical protein [Intestinibacter bartlettii]